MKEIEPLFVFVCLLGTQIGILSAQDGRDIDFGGRFRGFGRRTGDPPPKEQQLVEAGWGCATINAYSIQVDAGGETKNRFGPPRPPGAD